MTRSWLVPNPRNLTRWILAAGLLVMLGANLPGHLSVDSVIQLYEGRTGVRQTWAPAIVSWLLGLGDEVVSGAGLYVTASAALVAAALLKLVDLRPRAAWLAPFVALALVASPQFAVYQAIVWKDVLFANLAVAGFVALAFVSRAWEGRVLPGDEEEAPARAGLALGAALICFTLATLVRQNGIIVTVIGAVALGWSARGRGPRAAFVWGVGGLALTLLLALAVNAAVEPRQVSDKLRPDKAARILQHYDVIGAAAHDRRERLDLIAQADPKARDVLLSKGVAAYTPARIETLDADEAVRKALWRTPDAVMAAQWREVLTHRTGAYLAHRLDVFWQALATPDLAACLPVHVGVSGPPQMLEALQLAGRQDPEDLAMARYAERFYRTPLYSHLTFAAIAAVLAGFLLLRRDPGDAPIAALLVGALGFTASFFVISVACDYRYLYVLDVASMTGLLYVALDPGLSRRRRRLT